jgi:hypothetical protein
MAVPRLSRLVPGPLVRWFARPYVAGGSLEAGLAVAHDRFSRFGVLSTLDLLGEAVTRPFQVIENVASYEAILDALASDPRFADPATRPSVSLKPSAFTAGPPARARRPIQDLAGRARDRQVALTLDMEDRHWTDLTLSLAADLFRGGHDVGTALQTRLERTRSDLEAVPEGMRMRLVIGIYPEPEPYAVSDKPTMKQRMLEHAARLLERGCRVEFATHDLPCLVRFLEEVAPIAPDRCEIQMLLGVPRHEFTRRLLAGEFGVRVPFRLYVPFARSPGDTTAYLRRRMDESPNMMWLVLRNLPHARRAAR